MVKSIISSIIIFLAFIARAFQAGKNSQKAKDNAQTIENLTENAEINHKVDNMSFADLSSGLRKTKKRPY